MNNNVKVVIDAGHGGNDPGTSGNGLKEKDYTLLISQYMAERLKDLGYNVYLTREEDISLIPNERVNRIINAFGNNSDVLVISNHLNAGGAEGAEVIYALRNTDELSNKILNNLKEIGNPVRKAYQRRLPSNPSKDYYFIHRNTGITEPIIIEYGFLDNVKDSKRIRDNYQRLVEEVIKAISEYKNVPYSAPSISNTYRVKNGDTLWSIAKKFNTTPLELKKINNLNNNLLYINQILKVPDFIETIDTNINYVVKNNDTLYSISKMFNVTVDSIKSNNNLTTDILSLGQILNIPVGESNVLVKEDTKSDTTNSYIVKNGDTLYSIAKENNTTVNTIKELNNLIDDVLKIGMILLLPTNNIEEIITHTVVSGDSLWSISKTYNTTIDLIKSLNNLTTDLLNVGQELKVKRNTK